MSNFPQSYYSKLCQSYSLESFYSEDALIVMREESGREDEMRNCRKNEIVEGLLSVHAKKKVIKVLISTLHEQAVLNINNSNFKDNNYKENSSGNSSNHKDINSSSNSNLSSPSPTNNSLKLYNVVGQFVYHDNTTLRFTHVFLYDGLIHNEILTVLDEEIIYKNVNLRSKIGNFLNTIRIKTNSSLNKILNEFSSYGNVVAIENENNELLLEYENEENVKGVNMEMNGLRQRGYRIEFCSERI